MTTKKPKKTSEFSWEIERSPLTPFSAKRGEDIYSFVLSLKRQRHEYRLWPRQTIKMLKEYIQEHAEEYLIEGIEDAISKKTSLQENFKEQTQSVCSLLYNMFGAPNLSLYIAVEQGAVYIVRNAITTGNIIIMDEKGRPKMTDDAIVIDDVKKRRKKNKRIYDYAWAESVTGNTALHIAAKEGSHHHYQISRLLLQAGWNPAKMNVFGQTAIDIALLYGQKQYKRIVELLWNHRSSDEVPLLKFGANIDHRPQVESVRYTLSLWKEVEHFFNLVVENEIVESSDDEIMEEDEEILVGNDEGKGEEVEDHGKQESEDAKDEEEEKEEDMLESKYAEEDEGKASEEKQDSEQKFADGGTEEDEQVEKELIDEDMTRNAEGKEKEDGGKSETTEEKLEIIEKKKTHAVTEIVPETIPTTIPATEEQNLALYYAAYGFNYEVVQLAVEKGHEIFYHYDKYGSWQTRKLLKAIHYNRNWCNSTGMTALHSLCSRKGPLVLDGFENIGVAIARCLINNGWNVNKFTTNGDGKSAVDFAERNKLNKIAAIIHTTMPGGHKSQKWKTKQSLARDMTTTTRPATKMENHLLLWCARGFVNSKKNNEAIDGNEESKLPSDADESIDTHIMLKEKAIEDARKSKFYSDVSKGNINRVERERIEEEERAKLERLKEEEALGIEPYDAEEEGDKICDTLQQTQHRKQWLGKCVLAACFHGYELHVDQGIIKCKPVQPAIDYNNTFVDENGFTALHYASLRCHRKITMILIASGWAPDQTIRRLGQYYNNDSSKLALRGGDETLSEGLTAYASTEVTDFTSWILEADAREEKRRLEKIALMKKLAEEKAERIATILSILHKCGMAKSCDDAFVEKMKPDQVDDLIHIGMEDLMRCGVKKLAARSISRKLPGAVKQFQKKKGAS